MRFERTKNSTRTLIYGLINKLVVTILPFITRTIIIHKLGRDYLGLSSLFTSILTMLNISELGIGAAISFCMYKPVAEDDKDTIRKLMNLMRRLYMVIGLIILIIGLSLTPFINLLIKDSYPEEINIYILYLIYLFNTCVSYLLFAYKSTLIESYQRGDVIQKVNILLELIKYIFQIIVLLLFKNFYLFALSLPITQIIMNILVNEKSKKMFPDLYPEGKVSKETANIIKKKVGYLAIHSSTSMFTNAIDNIVVSSAIGLSAVAIYGNYLYIESAILSIIMLGYSSIRSSLGNILNSESKEKNYEVYKSLRFLSWWVSTFCTACMICMFQPFIELWVGGDNLLPFIAVVFLVLYFYTNCSRQFLSMGYINTSGLWNKTVIRQIITTFLNLFMDILLASKWGITGIIFASLFNYLIIGLPFDAYVVYKYVFNKKGIEGIIHEILRFMFMCLIVGLTYIISIQFEVGLFAKLIISALCGLIIPNIIIFIIYRDKEEFKFLINHLIVLKGGNN